MNNNQVFENDTKENYVKKLNASNDAKRLEQKVKAHNNAVRNNNLNKGSKSINTIANSSGGSKSAALLKYGKSENSTNSRMTNELASTGLTAAGVPKPLADAAVNSKLGQKAIEVAKKRNPMLNMLDKLMGGGQKETEEQTSDGGGQSFKIPPSVIKKIIIALPAINIVFVFMCLFMVASQIYLNSVKLGHADSLSSEEAEEKVSKTKVDDFNQEIKDDNKVAYSISIGNETLSFASKKLEKSNLEKTASTKYLKRKYNEADLSALEDFYPAVKDFSKNYDENMVYDFFYKMYRLYSFYRDEYDVYIDLPLLMATLNLQSNDMNVIFSSNLSSEDRKNKPRTDQEYKKDFKYDNDWSGYITNKDSSTHDMEVLVQNMVSNQVKEQCVDSNGKETNSKVLKDSQIGQQTLTCAEGETYKTESLGLVVDNEKYKEFLREFIEKKYYLDGDVPISGGNNVAPGQNNDENSDSNYNPSQSNGDWRNWKQCGQSWSNTIVPKSSSSMCDIGCLITSISIQIARSGTPTLETPFDPSVAVKTFSFADGGNFVWASTTNVAPNFQYYTAINLAGMNRDSIAQKLSSYDPNRYYIILAVSRKERNSVHHYVALDYVDLSNNNIYMMDPIGADTDLYDVYKLYKAHIFEKKD